MKQFLAISYLPVVLAWVAFSLSSPVWPETPKSLIRVFALIFTEYLLELEQYNLYV